MKEARWQKTGNPPLSELHVTEHTLKKSSCKWALKGYDTNRVLGPGLLLKVLCWCAFLFIIPLNSMEFSGATPTLYFIEVSLMKSPPCYTWSTWIVSLRFGFSQRLPLVPEPGRLSSSPLWPNCLSGWAETSRTEGSGVHDITQSKLDYFRTTKKIL